MAGQVGALAAFEPPASLPVDCTVGRGAGILILVPEMLNVLSDISSIVISSDLYHSQKPHQKITQKRT